MTQTLLLWNMFHMFCVYFWYVLKYIKDGFDAVSLALRDENALAAVILTDNGSFIQGRQAEPREKRTAGV